MAIGACGLRFHSHVVGQMEKISELAGVGRSAGVGSSSVTPNTSFAAGLIRVGVIRSFGMDSSNCSPFRVSQIR